MPLVHYWWDADWCSHCGNSMVCLMARPVIPLLGIYPKKPEILIQENICTLVFIAMLFAIAAQAPISK